MDRDQLYKVVDAILNQASEDDLEVIRVALQRRKGADEDEGGSSAFQFGPKKIAEESAHSISEQVSYSKSTIRNMIKNFAVDIIRKEAPELSDEQVRELLKAWIPDPESTGHRSQHKNRGSTPESPASNIPFDMMIAMIEQFIEYSEGRLSVRQQAQLRQEMGEWQEKYWKLFSADIKEAISLYLKGTIDKETFWLDVHKTLQMG